MALVSCTYCGKDVSEKAAKCPHCGKKLKKSKLILPVVLIVIIVAGCAGGYLGWNQYQKIQEEKRIEAERQRQEQIANLLAQVDELYVSFDFDEIENCYDALDDLQYDTSKQREILEYDRSVYKDAYAYYTAIKEVDDKLHQGGYTSLSFLISTMKAPTKKFEALEINLESEIGKYISQVRNNVMYSTFNSEYVNGTEYDLDYGLTSWGFELVIETYTEQIAAEKFPYIQ